MEDLGIDFENLSRVFQFYVEEICPTLVGQVRVENTETSENYTKILNFINVKKEKRAIENKLRKVRREPGTEIINLFNPLSTSILPSTDSPIYV